MLTNVPLLSGRGIGVEQTVHLPFSLGVASGVDVTEAEVDYSIDTVQKTSSAQRQPSEVELVQVKAQSVLQGTGDMLVGPSFNELAAIAPNVTSYFEQATIDNQMTIDGNLNEGTAALIAGNLDYMKIEFNLEIGVDFGKPTDVASVRESIGEEFSGETYIGPPADWATNLITFLNTNNYGINTFETRDASQVISALGAGFPVALVTEPEGTRRQEVLQLLGFGRMDGRGRLRPVRARYQRAGAGQRSCSLPGIHWVISPTRKRLRDEGVLKLLGRGALPLSSFSIRKRSTTPFRLNSITAEGQLTLRLPRSMAPPSSASRTSSARASGWAPFLPQGSRIPLKLSTPRWSRLAPAW